MHMNLAALAAGIIGMCLNFFQDLVEGPLGASINMENAIDMAVERGDVGLLFNLALPLILAAVGSFRVKKRVGGWKFFTASALWCAGYYIYIRSEMMSEAPFLLAFAKISNLLIWAVVYAVAAGLAYTDSYMRDHNLTLSELLNRP